MFSIYTLFSWDGQFLLSFSRYCLQINFTQVTSKGWSILNCSSSLHKFEEKWWSCWSSTSHCWRIEQIIAYHSKQMIMRPCQPHPGRNCPRWENATPIHQSNWIKPVARDEIRQWRGMIQSPLYVISIEPPNCNTARNTRRDWKTV